MVTQFPNSLDTRDDLAYSILLALGGNMSEVEVIYQDTHKDLLFAILQRIKTGGLVFHVDRFKVLVANDNRQTINYPQLVGANGVEVFIGGMNLDNEESLFNRYYLVNTLTGDLDLPPVNAGEFVVILKS